MLTEEDLRRIEEIVKKHKSTDGYGSGCVTILMVLFILGVFKGCGY